MGGLSLCRQQQQKWTILFFDKIKTWFDWSMIMTLVIWRGVQIFFFGWSKTLIFIDGSIFFSHYLIHHGERKREMQCFVNKQLQCPWHLKRFSVCSHYYHHKRGTKYRDFLSDLVYRIFFTENFISILWLCSFSLAKFNLFSHFDF